MMKLKICGIKDSSEIQMLDSLGVDFIGLWNGIPKGKHNLNRHTIQQLMNVKTKHAKLTLVTLISNFERLADIIKTQNIKAVQLQGFQLPGLVSKLKSAFLDLDVLKVLHIKPSGECLEETLIQRYWEANVDYFILDTYISKQKIGSTGQQVNLELIKPYSERLGAEKVFIAGGISEKNVKSIKQIIKPFGVDIDTHARENGNISSRMVAGIKNKIGR